MATKITATIKAMPGDKVLVYNYRGNGRWENGIVHSVQVGVRSSGETSNSYDVITDRKVISRRYPYGRPIRLSVGDDKIIK